MTCFKIDVGVHAFWPYLISLQHYVVRLLAFCVLSLPCLALATRFGGMEVLSHQGEPLLAKIEILAVPVENQGWLKLQPANRAAYDKASLRFTSAAKNLKTSLFKDKQGHLFAWLTTTQVVVDESIDLLITLRWSTGEMTEAFTLFIPRVQGDFPAIIPPMVAIPELQTKTETAPPVLEQEDTSTLADHLPQIAPEHQMTTYPPLQKKPQAQNQKSFSESAAIKKHDQQLSPKKTGLSPDTSYTVQAGDHLNRLALKLKQDVQQVQLVQLLWALYQHNPQAFAQNNINHLKAGAVLHIPDVATLQSVDRREASKNIRLQTEEFKRYQKELAERATPSQSDAQSPQTSSGNAPSTLAVTPGAPQKNELQLSPKNQKAMADQERERRVAIQSQLEEEQAKVKQLEQHVADLQKLVALNQKLKNQDDAVFALPQSKESAVTKSLPHSFDFLLWAFGIGCALLLIFYLFFRMRKNMQKKSTTAPESVLTALSLDLDPEPSTAKPVPLQDKVLNASAFEKKETTNLRLELAQAYWDLGDKDGALQLLDEIIAHGDEAQKQQAEALRATLS